MIPSAREMAQQVRELTTKAVRPEFTRLERTDCHKVSSVCYMNTDCMWRGHAPHIR